MEKITFQTHYEHSYFERAFPRLMEDNYWDTRFLKYYKGGQLFISFLSFPLTIDVGEVNAIDLIHRE